VAGAGSSCSVTLCVTLPCKAKGNPQQASRPIPGLADGDLL